MGGIQLRIPARMATGKDHPSAVDKLLFGLGLFPGIGPGFGMVKAAEAAPLAARTPAAMAALLRGAERARRPTLNVTPSDFDLAVPADEAFTDWLAYVTKNDQEAATRFAARYAESPDRAKFLDKLRGAVGGEEINVYRAGEVVPGRLQSYTRRPNVAAWFGRKHNAPVREYRAPISEVAFPGASDDEELVIPSAAVKAIVDAMTAAK